MLRPFLLGLTSLLPAAAAPPEGDAARFRSGTLGMAQFEHYLGRALRFREEGREALEHLAQLHVVRREAKARGFVVTNLEAGRARLEARLKRSKIEASALDSVPRSILESYLLLERLVAEDFGLPPGSVPTPGQQELWLADQGIDKRLHLPERGSADVVATIDGKAITVAELGASLRTRLAPATLETHLRDAVEERLAAARATRLGLRVTAADIESELAERQALLRRNPRFANLSLQELAAHQGKSAEFLRNDPMLHTWILWRKIVAKSRGEEAWRTLYRARKAHWDREVGEERRYSWIAIPRPQGSKHAKALDLRAREELAQVRAKIGRKLTFAQAARVYSRDGATRDVGGQVSGWHTRYQARSKKWHTGQLQAVFGNPEGTTSRIVTLPRVYALFHVDAVLPVPNEPEMIAKLQRFGAADERRKQLAQAAIVTYLDPGF